MLVSPAWADWPAPANPASGLTDHYTPPTQPSPSPPPPQLTSPPTSKMRATSLLRTAAKVTADPWATHVGDTSSLMAQIRKKLVVNP